MNHETSDEDYTPKKNTNTERRRNTELTKSAVRHTGPVAVSAEVFRGLEAVRRSGLTNMLDRPRVAEIAEEFDFEEAARWIESHRREYAEGIFRGFRVEAEGEGPAPEAAVFPREAR